MLPILRDAHVYLLHFDCEQTMADLRELDALANRTHKPNVGIAVVNYTRLHPAIVKKYAVEGIADFENLVRHLMRHLHELENLGESSFQHPPEGFTFRFRNVLRSALAPFVLGVDDLVLCSRGAFEVMSTLVVRSGARVVAVHDGLGGSTTFTTTLCTADFLRDLGALLAEPRERPLRRVFVPAPVWWLNGGRCIGGGTVDELREAFPQVEFIPVAVPNDVIDSRLTLRQCYDWYNADVTKTVELMGHPEALTGRLAPLEGVTEAGFARRLVLVDDSPFAAFSPPVSTFDLEPVALEALGELDDLTSVLVTYEELLVERSDEAFPDEQPGAIRRLRASLGGEEIPVRRTLVRKYPLVDRATRALFIALFVERRGLEDVVAAIDEADDDTRALARAMYAALASLELRGDAGRRQGERQPSGTPPYGAGAAPKMSS
jgi:hypothetical protein